MHKYGKTMYKKIIVGLLSGAFLTSSALASGVQVNGTPISQARIDAVMQIMTAQAQQQGQAVDPRMKDMVRDQLITAEVLSQEAIRKGLNKQPAVEAQLQNAQAMTLANQLISEFQRTSPVTNADILAAYNQIKAATPVKKSYHAQHILVATAAQANAILDALRKGKPFDQLAREQSIDTGSKANGGDLGWSDASNFVGPFGDALAKLAKGQISATPVHTQFGWHIIKLDDVRTEAFPPLASLRQQLQQRLASDRINKYIGDLRAKAKIVQ
jgi:peptidyl-prolyl cis-trans isomerase C